MLRGSLDETLGFLCGAAEAVILVTRALGESRHRTEKKNTSGVYTENQEKKEAWVSGAEIQTLAVDTRSAIWGIQR